MYEDLRAAVEVLKNYCTEREYCTGCPLNHVVCHNGSINPIGYPLPRFDRNVKELKEHDKTVI